MLVFLKALVNVAIPFKSREHGRRLEVKKFTTFVFFLGAGREQFGRDDAAALRLFEAQPGGAGSGGRPVITGSVL